MHEDAPRIKHSENRIHACSHSSHKKIVATAKQIDHENPIAIQKDDVSARFHALVAPGQKANKLRVARAIIVSFLMVKSLKPLGAPRPAHSNVSKMNNPTVRAVCVLFTAWG